MEIETIVIIALVAIPVTILGFLVTRRLVASRSPNGNDVSDNVPEVSVSHISTSIVTPATSPSIRLASVDDPTVGGDLVVFGTNGEVILSCREVDYLPPHHDPDDGKHDAALNRARQLATDLITRSMTLPNKKIEIVFDPEIQKGLSSGAYEVVKVASGDGQRLMARAKDSKKFVGHGRLMDAGKLKQLGVGAFHIVSIAVAQAHLAEINKNLEEIKEGVKDIRYFLEDKDIAELKGTVEYLEYVVNFIRRMDSPDRLPIEKRAELESIRREMMVWVAQIEQEAIRLRERIVGQGDEDGWGGGTGNTFEKLKELARVAERLIRKYRLFLRTANLFYMTAAYLDPMALRDRDIARILQPDEATNALSGALQQLEKKSKTLLSSAVWNTAERLKLRQNYMKQEVRQLGGQARAEKQLFADGMARLELQLSRIGDPQGNLRMAITFDSAGNPEHVKLV